MIRTLTIRIAVIVLALVFSAGATFAQDKITTMSGEEINGKVVEIGPRFITYKKQGASDGPLYTLRKADVSSIRFESGMTEVFRERRGEGGMRREALNASEYGSTIISLSPIQMTHKSATGFGIHFERMLDKRGLFSFYMPVAVSIRGRNNTNYYGSGTLTSNDRSPYVFAFPGIRIYPTSSKGVVRYSVGPALGFGVGRNKYTRSDQVYDPVTGGYNTRLTAHDDAVFQSGIIINNGLNIQPTPALRVGLELGLGYMYTNNEYNYYGYAETPMVQFNFSIGYRF